jgi:hypothetical protein
MVPRRIPESSKRPYMVKEAPFSEDSFKIKAPILHWLRDQVAGAPLPSSNQPGFETEPTKSLGKLCSQKERLRRRRRFDMGELRN